MQYYHAFTMLLLSHFTDVDSKYPGVLFYGPPVTEQLTSSGIEICHIEDIGISVTIPENLLSCTDSVNLSIRPCFHGPFLLPDDHVSASPAYLIKTNRKVPFQKDFTIRIHHHTRLQGEEDCNDMVFLSASATPEYRGAHPVYTFKKIPEVKGTFRLGDQVGEISVRGFSFIKAGKRKRERKGASSDAKRQRGKEFYFH